MSRDRDRTRSRPARQHDHLIKLRGLPPASNKEDIRQFLYPCRMAAVHFFNQTELSSGECLVDLESEGDVRNALKKTNQCMGSRPIEVIQSNQHEYNFFAKHKGSLSWHDPVLRMNGLPYTCTMANVQLFFKDIEIARNGIYITRDMSDNPLGGGYVAFVNMDNAYKAIDLYQQKRIAHRYIELTPSTYDEAKKTIANDAHVNGKRFAGEDDDESKQLHVNNGPNKRTRSNRRSRSSSAGRFTSEQSDSTETTLATKGDRRQELKRRRSTSASPQTPSRDAQNNHDQRSRSRSATHRHSTSSNHKVEYLIKMRGMPYTVSERDIRQFFPTTCQPVRIDIVQDRRLKRANGDGHAYFNTREEAAEAMKCDRKYMGTRYIELYFDSPRSRSTSPTNDRSRSRSQSQPRM